MSKKDLPNYPGVRPHGNGIQIEVRYKGRRLRPTLKMAPTRSNLRLAISVRESIRRDIVVGNIDINKYFSDTKIAEHFEQKYSSRLTVSELLDDWFERNKNIGNSSHERSIQINKHLKPHIGKIRITELKPKHVRTMQQKLAENIANKSINNALTPLRKAFSEAFNDELIDRNVLERVENLDIQKKKVAPLTFEQADSVLEFMKRVPDHHNFYQFALWTGLSTGEQLGLKWSDVDFEENNITINRMWVSGKGRRPTKNKKRIRKLGLIQPAIDALLRQRGLQYNSEWVFINSDNVEKTLDEDLKPWSSEKIARPWNAALKALSFPALSAYSTRHFYASIMLSAGMSMEWLKEKMGHSNYRMLEEVYASWVKISAKERKKIREWVLEWSQNGHIPDADREYFE
ncbi:MAG: tyrosine-type recombinase/integrase [Pseudomonadota bacterium]